MKVDARADKVFVRCEDITGCIGEYTTCTKCPLYLYEYLSIQELVDAVRTVTLDEIKAGYYEREGITYTEVQQKGGDV